MLDIKFEKQIKNKEQYKHKQKISDIEEELTKETTCEKKDYKDINQMREFMKKTPIAFRENFELQKFLSYGSVGTVYEGKYKKGNQLKVGLKFLLLQEKDKKKGKNILNEKNKEILILKKLHHPNIINLYGNYKLNEYNSCAILELAKYGDLENFQKNFLKRKYLSETSINYLAKQILDALEYIHGNKIIHLDIKEDNILIDSFLNVKITDFSISTQYKKFKENDKVFLPFAGTTKFICPEILGKKEIYISECPKVDIYSLGIVLYHLAFGIYPFGLSDVHGRDYDEIKKKINKNELEFPKDITVSPMFKDFLKKLLEKDIEKRFDIKQALEHRWIKGSRIIFDEKERICCLEKFLILLITDSIPEFNEYIKFE